ncbi:hypothetical protein P5673_009355, partial [Acropora cervicornis]
MAFGSDSSLLHPGSCDAAAVPDAAPAPAVEDISMMHAPQCKTKALKRIQPSQKECTSKCWNQIVGGIKHQVISKLLKQDQTGKEQEKNRENNGVLITKSLGIPHLIYSKSMLVTPSEVVSSVTTSLFDFIWCKKPDKIKRQVMYQDYVDGGLRVPNMEVMAKSLKLAWISRFLSTDALSRKENWKAIPYHFFREYGGLNFLLRCNRPFFLKDWFDLGIRKRKISILSRIPTNIQNKMILVSKKELHLFGVSNNSNCTYCGQPDSISHTFIGCHHSKTFFQNVLQHFNVENATSFTLSDKELLFGKPFNTIDQLQRSPLLKKLNYCMLLAKYYLYNQKLNQIEPELNEFKNRLNFQYRVEKL